MKTIDLNIILALAVSLPLQAQYPIESYELATPGFDYYYKPFAEQSNLFDLYAPSEITLKNNLQLSGSGGSDGYVDIPYGEVENALKISVGNGLGTLIVCLLGYALFKKKRNSTKLRVRIIR
jgi:hypothetical protein